MQTIMIVEDDPDIRDGVRIALDCNRVWVDEQEADLTETEYKILKLLMQSPHRIFPAQDISVRFVKENGKAGLAFENAVLPGQHRTDSTKVGLTSIETMMEKMHAACRIEQSGERFCITLLFPIALSVTPQA